MQEVLHRWEEAIGSTWAVFAVPAECPCYQCECLLQEARSLVNNVVVPDFLSCSFDSEWEACKRLFAVAMLVLSSAFLALQHAARQRASRQ